MGRCFLSLPKYPHGHFSTMLARASAFNNFYALLDADAHTGTLPMPIRAFGTMFAWSSVFINTEKLLNVDVLVRGAGFSCSYYFPMGLLDRKGF